MSLADRLSGGVPGGRAARTKSSNSLRSKPYSASPRSSGRSSDREDGKRDLDAKWTHDKYAPHNGIEGGELGARMTGDVGRQITSGASGSSRLVNRAFAGVLGKPEPKGATSDSGGLSIKGASTLAGTGVEVDGLAPGTTAEDVAEIFSSCGKIVEHRLLTRPDSPTVRVFLHFETAQGAQTAVARFDKQTADGRTLNVFVVSAGSLASRMGFQGRSAPPKKNVDLLADSTPRSGGMRSDEIMQTDPRAKLVSDPSGANKLIQSIQSTSNGNERRNERKGGRGRGGKPGGPARSLSSRMQLD
ncbi:hypothetical protein PIIN_04282 [Serendipita indica DSM 11827]|uniref:RRM domain-containing protein n=1 Tax=Serendipita indica (strain DSM 11827) TaxID=1109443 RepID=G4TG97_SERID|nr:hypothetical protein PIIN_04282 [Serendipita indica DSM 11827]